MRIAEYKGEGDLAEVARRLFHLKGRRALEFEQQAQVALLQANPRLRELGDVPAGTLIYVPEIPGLQANVEATTPVGPSAEPLAHARLALNGARAVLGAALDRQAAAAEETIASLAKPEVKALVKKHPDLKKRLPLMADAAKARIDSIAPLKAAHDQSLARIESDIDNFIKRHCSL